MSKIKVGFIGAGFIAKFHAKSWKGVRNSDITAVASRTKKSAREFAELCEELEVGSPKVYDDLTKMLRESDIDAIWVTVPNYVKADVIEKITSEVKAGNTTLKAIAVEKPLARNLKEAETIVKMIEDSGLLNGYLENQVFAPNVVRGKEIIWNRGARIAGNPYLVRTTEEHSGPHEPWFWQGSKQGGGVLSDMMCHSVEAGRYLLTPPEEINYLTPKLVRASISSLKWSRDKYINLLKKKTNGKVDYSHSPAEDFATAEIFYETPDNEIVISQVTTSWSYVGPGLRLTFELLGPEYSLAINTLDPESNVFFSRNIKGKSGEDLVEKQEAEQGQMPYLGDETHVYGYTGENRHMIESFSKEKMPRETVKDGLLVTKLLMAAYKSAETGASVHLDKTDLSNYIPLVQKEKWNPKDIFQK